MFEWPKLFFEKCNVYNIFTTILRDKLLLMGKKVTVNGWPNLKPNN